MRRAAARINQADDLLLNTYRDMHDTVSRFLRDDILSWLNGAVFLDTITRHKHRREDADGR